MQRRRPALCAGMNLGPFGQPQLHECFMPGSRRPMQWCEAKTVGRIDVGSFGQERFYEGLVPDPHGRVQRRPPDCIVGAHVSPARAEEIRELTTGKHCAAAWGRGNRLASSAEQHEKRRRSPLSFRVHGSAASQE